MNKLPLTRFLLPLCILLLAACGSEPEQKETEAQETPKEQPHPMEMLKQHNMNLAAGTGTITKHATINFGVKGNPRERDCRPDAGICDIGGITSSGGPDIIQINNTSGVLNITFDASRIKESDSALFALITGNVNDVMQFSGSYTFTADNLGELGTSEPISITQDMPILVYPDDDPAKPFKYTLSVLGALPNRTANFNFTNAEGVMDADFTITNQDDPINPTYTWVLGDTSDGEIALFAYMNMNNVNELGGDINQVFPGGDMERGTYTLENTYVFSDPDVAAALSVPVGWEILAEDIPVTTFNNSAWFCLSLSVKKPSTDGGGDGGTDGEH